MAHRIAFLGFVALAVCASLSLAAEPASLQDFCVADASGNTLMNGMACKNPAMVQASDFAFSGLHIPGNTSDAMGFRVTLVSMTQIPGLNTLGICLHQVDYAPWGIVPLHTHPRAIEILTVIEGSLEVGFVTSNPGNRHITKILKKGDVFVFPVGQNPGVITIANTVFGSKPDISTDLLAKAFQVDKSAVWQLQAKF
ncbi:unnamed protein product [Linum tenue]|uniref:Germin-like protein n=1 Tax=Linum tenue TaxID=586396 RepID=A0AAV0KNB7_9ROSI|nr:unnamed protein product [Linum tenue]